MISLVCLCLIFNYPFFVKFGIVIYLIWIILIIIVFVKLNSNFTLNKYIKIYHQDIKCKWDSKYGFISKEIDHSLFK